MTKEEAQLEQLIGKLIDDKMPKNSNHVSRIIQGVILAGIIGLFVQFNEVKEATLISESERAAFKEDINELKTDIRSLRYELYRSNGGQIDKNGAF